MNYKNETQTPLKTLLKTLSILVLTTLITLIPNYKVQANEIPLFNTFQHGISIETEEIPKDSKLVAGPWFLTSNSTGPIEFLKKFNLESNKNKTPYVYFYLTAGNAKNDGGLDDCNLGLPPEKTLCKVGANYLKKHKDRILQEYIASSHKIRTAYGTTKPILIHIEPDFYQYNGSSQFGGPIALNEMKSIMNSWTDAIKYILPNASLVMDISPWHYDLAGFSKGLRNYTYAGLVGKRFDPNGDGDCGLTAGIDCKSYALMSMQTGKKLIINDSHGPGGAWLSTNYNWYNTELIKARSNDNVIAVFQPPIDLTTFANTVRRYDMYPIDAVENDLLTSPSKTVSYQGDIYTCKTNNTLFTVNKSSSWQTGMVVNIKVKPLTDKPVLSWESNLELNPNQFLTNSWNTKITNSANNINIKPIAQWNSVLQNGKEIEIGMVILDYNPGRPNQLPKIANCQSF